jgi:hypothetical protein
VTGMELHGAPSVIPFILCTPTHHVLYVLWTVFMLLRSSAPSRAAVVLLCLLRFLFLDTVNVHEAWTLQTSQEDEEYLA